MITLPAWVPPQIATPAEAPMLGEEWVHEHKLDGYRILVRIAGRRARLLTPTRHDWSRRFPAITRAAARLPVREALLDGEIVALDRAGVSRFEALPRETGGDHRSIAYVAFDLLFLDGQDLRPAALVERKACLSALLAGRGRRLRYLAHSDACGRTFHVEACRAGLAGTVSKRKDAPYSSGRGETWLEVTCGFSQAFVIGGFTEPEGARRGFGALLLGVHDRAGRLVYAGRVGTGFSHASLRALTPRLLGLEQRSSPFAAGTERMRPRGIHWVQPVLVAEVGFTEWAPEGLLRHPAFQGLMEHRSAGEIVRERPESLRASRSRRR